MFGYGFFLYDVINRFDKICEDVGKLEYVAKYEGIKNSLKLTLNDKAWDGEWFRRAYMDDRKSFRK